MWKRIYNQQVKSRKGLGQRGLAAVEFALFLSLALVPLLVVLVEGSYALKAQMVLQEAAREGPRQVLRTSSTDGVSQLLGDLTGDLPEADTAVHSQITTDVYANTITVRVTYDYQSLYFGDMLDSAFEGQEFQLEAAATMPLP